MGPRNKKIDNWKFGPNKARFRGELITAQRRLESILRNYKIMREKHDFKFFIHDEKEEYVKNFGTSQRTWARTWHDQIKKFSGQENRSDCKLPIFLFTVSFFHGKYAQNFGRKKQGFKRRRPDGYGFVFGKRP